MPSAKYTRPMVEASCECGGTWKGKLNALKTGNTTSCGCAHFYADYSGEVGKKYGRLTVVSVLPRDRWVSVFSVQKGRDVQIPAVVANCDCGATWEGRLYSLRSGQTKSCGCLSVEMSHTAKYIKHGMCKAPEYSVYRAMLKRCYNPNHKSYKDYGGRGISVCAAWLESFENFYKDMGPRPGPEFSVDRIDNERGYEPTNCRWALPDEQQNNRRSCHYVEYCGDRLTVTQLAKALGVHRRTLTDRLRKNPRP